MLTAIEDIIGLRDIVSQMTLTVPLRIHDFRQMTAVKARQGYVGVTKNRLQLSTFF